jgi:hypothetical protein
MWSIATTSRSKLPSLYCIVNIRHAAVRGVCCDRKLFYSIYIEGLEKSGSFCSAREFHLGFLTFFMKPIQYNYP